jgi:hypothetical protein
MGMCLELGDNSIRYPFSIVEEVLMKVGHHFIPINFVVLEMGEREKPPRHEGRLSDVGTMGKRSVAPDADAFQMAHFSVIQQLHLITPFANESKRQLREKTLTVVGLGLQRCTCKVSAGGSEIMSRHVAIML